MEVSKKTDPTSDNEETELKTVNSPLAVQTPDTKCRKRLLSATPPNTDPSKGDDTDIVTSPSQKQDVKKRVVTDEKGHNTPTGLKDPQNNNKIDNKIPETPSAVTKGRRGRGRGRGRVTRSVSRKRPSQPRAQSVDGSPTEKTASPTDILSILSELKNTKIEIFQKIDTKVDDLKEEFQSSIASIRENIDEINSDIIDLGQTQQNLANRVQDISVNVKDNTEYISSVKSQNEQQLQTVSTHIQDIEVSLATDIETLKLNIEDKLCERNDSLADMKEQLSAIQTEYEAERDKSRGEFKRLYDDFNSLQQSLKGQDTSEIKPDYPSLNQGIFNSKKDDEYRQRAKERVDRFKNIVVDGLYESPNENLIAIIGHMCHDMKAPIDPNEVIEATRIGPPDSARRWPRPVRVTFDSEPTRMRIYENRNNLLETKLFGNIRINSDEPKDVRVKRAKIRQAAEMAVKAGKTVLAGKRPGDIQIDGVVYNMLNIDQIPEEYRSKPGECKIHSNNTNYHRMQTQPQPVNPISHTATENITHTEHRKPYRTAYRRLKDGATRVDMVGPCLQKTKRGLAFISGKCFLSNFFKCPVRYNGFEYKTSEHCWQAQKALICKDPIAMAEIKSVNEPFDAKRIGD